MKKYAEFIKKYELKSKKVNLSVIKSVIKKQGFIIINYKQYNNQPEIENLLKLTKTFEYSITKDSYTFINDSKRIVFIKDGLSDEDTLYLLLHEAWHIFKEHVFINGIINHSDIQKEKEANEFASYIIKRNKYIVNPYKKAILGVLCSTLILVGYYIFNKSLNSPSEIDTDSFQLTRQDQSAEPEQDKSSVNDKIVYVTKTGEKYHLKDCYTIKNSILINMTRDEAEQAGYEPCKTCRPEIK